MAGQYSSNGRGNTGGQTDICKITFADHSSCSFPHLTTARPTIDIPIDNHYGMQMCKFQLKSKAILVMLCSFFFLAGVISVSANFSGSLEADLCCDSDAAEQQLPSNDTECNDPGCRCLSCSVSLLEDQQLSNTSAQDPDAPLWQLAAASPSNFIRSIDYPPEQL